MTRTIVLYSKYFHRSIYYMISSFQKWVFLFKFNVYIYIYNNFHKCSNNNKNGKNKILITATFSWMQHFGNFVGHHHELKLPINEFPMTNSIILKLLKLPIKHSSRSGCFFFFLSHTKVVKLLQILGWVNANTARFLILWKIQTSTAVFGIGIWWVIKPQGIHYFCQLWFE